MRKLIIFLILILGAILAMTIFFQPHRKVERKNSGRTTFSKKNKNSFAPEKKDIRNEIGNSSSLTIFTEDDNKKKLKTQTNNATTNDVGSSKKKKQQISEKNAKFVTTEDVIDSLFPRLEERVGQEYYNEFITAFPYSFVGWNLTPAQKKEYRQLIVERSNDGNINIPDNELTKEEIFKKMNELNRIYIPRFINILTKKQQKEFVKKTEEVLLQKRYLKK